MSITVDCPACGRHLNVAIEQAGKRVRCPGCNSTVAVPDQFTYGVALDPSDLQVDPEPKGPARRPRQALKEGEKACPNCRAALPRKAVLCVDCGYDFRIGAQRETESRLFEQEWDGGIGIPWRIVWLVVVECMLLLASAGWVFLAGEIVGPAPPALGVLMFAVIFLATSGLFIGLIGTFPRLRLERTEQGKTLLTRTLWIGFVPIKKETTDLRKIERIIISQLFGLNLKGYLTFIALTLVMIPMCCPGPVIWLWVFTRSHYFVLLERKNGQTVEVYFGANDARVRELVEMLKGLTDLPIDRK